MIFVDRKKYNKAEGFKSEKWEDAKLKARDFFKRTEAGMDQIRHAFLDPNNFPELKERILEDFHYKCAYTEAPLNGNEAVIIRHWPESDATNLDGKSSPDHYWWLAYKWDNLIPVLLECVRAKQNYFPVKEDRLPYSEVENGRNDQPLLPDPNRVNPFKGMTFETDGLVCPSRDIKDPSLVKAIIDILGLNTERVVQMRQNLYKNFLASREKLHSILMEAVKKPDTAYDLWIDRESNFIEFRIFLIVQWFQQNFPEDKDRLGEYVKIIDGHIQSILPQQPFLERFDPGFLESTFGEKAQEMIRRQVAAKSIKSEDVSGSSKVSMAELEAAAEKTSPILKGLYLERVHIENFKGIQSMKLDFGRPVSDEPNLLMVLGENASGKSSILQAIALCLENPEKLKDLSRFPYLHPDRIRNRKANSGFVKIKFLDQSGELEIHFKKGEEGYRHEGPYDSLGYYLRGYGPHRILPRHNDGSELPTESPLVMIHNLWDPFECLVDAGRWIEVIGEEDSRIKESAKQKNTDSESEITEFDLFMRALKDLLNLETEGFMEYSEEGLFFNVLGQQVPLDDLSSGFQSIIGTAADIIVHSPFSGADPKEIRGIVLIDEIGAHLHPSWRMRIVSAYRNTFPHVQFIATTHEPLCLRGLREWELVVLRKGADSVELVEDLPNVEEMRIDQILTSPVFGLNTTMDPKVERDFKRYYDLLVRLNLSDEEQDEKERLKKSLYRYGVLGTDRRSRAIYDVIDRELAIQGKQGKNKRLPKKARNLILEIWEDSKMFKEYD